jgi:two-component system, OmpR family, sensor kinase
MAIKLYLRIWLAIVGVIAALTLVLTLLGQQHAKHLRLQFREHWQPEIEVRDDQQRIVGRALSMRGQVGQPRDQAGSDEAPMLRPPPRVLRVELDDGRRLELSLPRRPPPPAPWFFSPLGLALVLALVVVAMAAAVYPVVRRLTRRLEALQQGVERWGRGDLTMRLPVEGRDEVAFLAQKFNHAADQVNALLQTHQSLLANASHELRSPLARIRMSMALLADQPKGMGEKLQFEIQRSLTELDALIEEILLASRLDNPSASLGTTESFDLMGLAAEECARTGAELLVTQNVLGGMEMQGHPKLVRRLLRNLLENAQRHNHPERGGVTLALSGTATELKPGDEHPASDDENANAYWVITVRDHGVGVPREECERIFEPFYRASNASESDGGVGLGLALVKSIAERHGGSVACLPMQGAGACFVVKLAVTMM